MSDVSELSVELIGPMFSIPDEGSAKGELDSMLNFKRCSDISQVLATTHGLGY